MGSLITRASHKYYVNKITTILYALISAKASELIILIIQQASMSRSIFNKIYIFFDYYKTKDTTETRIKTVPTILQILKKIKIKLKIIRQKHKINTTNMVIYID